MRALKNVIYELTFTKAYFDFTVEEKKKISETIDILSKKLNEKNENI